MRERIGLFAAAVVLLVGCPSVELVQQAPSNDYATLVINNVSDLETNAGQSILKVRVEGPLDIGFSPNMLIEDSSIRAGESGIIYLDTQGGTGEWLIQVTYLHPNAEGVLSRFRMTVKFPSVKSGIVYTWNWAGHTG